MKIAIIGSMKFTQEMLATEKKLRELGHDANIPLGVEPHLSDGTFVDNLEDNLAFCIEHNVMRRNFQQVAESDAVVVLNYKRNGVEGYIGISALMEMAIAHFLKKKIFLMRATPKMSHARWAHEVAIMQPTVINDDLKKIR